MRDELTKRLEDDEDPLAEVLNETERRFLRSQLDLAGVNDAQMPWFLELHEEARKAVEEGGRPTRLRPFTGPEKRKRGRKRKDGAAMLVEFQLGIPIEKIQGWHDCASPKATLERIKKAADDAEIPLEAVQHPAPPLPFPSPA